MGGATVTYRCPRAAPEPSCLHYSKAAKTWTTAGCAVARADLTSIVCACDHLADFGTRFAALDSAPPRVFVGAAPRLAFAPFASAAALYAVVALLLCGTGCAPAAGARGARAAAAAAVAALERDPEVALLRFLQSAKEGSSARDWALDEWRARGEGGASAKVAPAGGASEPLQQQAPAHPLCASLPLLATPPLPAPPAPGGALAPWAAALRAAAANPPPAPPAEAAAPLAPLALAAARLRHGAHGASLLGALSCRPRASFAGWADYASPSGGLLRAAVGHTLLLLLGATAVLYARVFGVTARGGSTLTPPLEPLAGGGLLLTALAGAVVGAALAGAARAAAGAGAAAFFAARFPRLEREARTRAAFAAAAALLARESGARALTGDEPLPLPTGVAPSPAAYAAWLLSPLAPLAASLGGATTGGALSEPAVVTLRTLLPALEAAAAAALPLRGARPPPRAPLALAAAAPWAASLFAAYYAVLFGMRHGAGAAGSLLAASALAAAIYFAAVQPLWAAAAAAWDAGGGAAALVVPALEAAGGAGAAAAARAAPGAAALSRLQLATLALPGAPPPPFSLLFPALLPAAGEEAGVGGAPGAAAGLASVLPPLLLALRVEALLAAGVSVAPAAPPTPTPPDARFGKQPAPGAGSRASSGSAGSGAAAAPWPSGGAASAGSRPALDPAIVSPQSTRSLTPRSIGWSAGNSAAAAEAAAAPRPPPPAEEDALSAGFSEAERAWRGRAVFRPALLGAGAPPRAAGAAWPRAPTPLSPLLGGLVPRAALAGASGVRAAFPRPPPLALRPPLPALRAAAVAPRAPYALPPRPLFALPAAARPRPAIPPPRGW